VALVFVPKFPIVSIVPNVRIEENALNDWNGWNVWNWLSPSGSPRID
jgi:hypothetical protein